MDIVLGIIGGIVIQQYVKSQITKKIIKEMTFCTKSHSQNADNYPWLNDIHGGVKEVYYEEPAGSGNWRKYDDTVWEAHCKVIKHNSVELVDDHLGSFVLPGRFARLKFVFNDSFEINSDIENIEFFRGIYELEKNYFKNAGF
jgi:hypothetical protein